MSQEYPKWAQVEQATGGLVSTQGSMYNAREVAPGLHVGGAVAVMLRKPEEWSLVVDYDGVSQQDDNEVFYPQNALYVLRFADGRPFPRAFLDRTLELFERISPETRAERPVLLHCAMGMSRSASAAYAILRVHYELDHGEALRRVRVGGDLGYPMERTLAAAVAWAEDRLWAQAQAQAKP